MHLKFKCYNGDDKKYDSDCWYDFPDYMEE